ncbi:MAG: nuclear transport factor 2 family protein [Nevskiales bacterium]|nr:nuclear transport factor 2 family protein [Nevskiales bacterium]
MPTEPIDQPTFAMSDFNAGNVRSRLVGLLLVLGLLPGCSGMPATEDLGRVRAQVAATERAFAQTMADRDHDTFTGFLDDDAIFIGARQTLRGKAAVSEAWSAYFASPTAPFSWEPETVEVRPSGDLALSAGPVRAASGEVVGSFQSIWRRGADGQWRIIFDKGCEACRCPAP